mmetsp:Transcript_103927/g.171009  ORF Transcript_103927/g.171009 Transcript_103927/m.171009 type:complete len:223 (-) Transcript_103927:122-790(-)
MVVSPILDALGQAQALAIAPFSTWEGITAFASAHRDLHSLFTSPAVCRRILASNFRPAAECLGAVAQEVSPQEYPTLEALWLRVPDKRVKQAYHQLRRVDAKPFTLDHRSRLLLEIYELQDWDKHQSRFTVQRQAKRLADIIEHSQASARLREVMAPSALELVSLKNMMNDGVSATQLLEQTEVECPSPLQELRRLKEKRLQQRRKYWQRQREYLLQDLEWQ